MTLMKNRILLTALLLLPSLALAQDEPDSVYVNISPDFVTNYDEGARLKYLKASVALKIVGVDEESVRLHIPSIKNTLIILFTSQAEENLTSTVGRESLRREALDEVRRIMSTLERGGDQQIEDLYFTNFIVQQ
jgi:flagellar protein FliL